MKRCFPNTEVIVVDSVTNAVLAFNQGGPTRSCSTTRRSRSIAAADPAAKLTNDMFLEPPYGIGIKQGNVAAEALGRLAARDDEAKDLFLPILRNNIAPRFVPEFSQNILRPNNNFAYRAGDPPERRHRVSVG